MGEGSAEDEVERANCEANCELKPTLVVGKRWSYFQLKKKSSVKEKDKCQGSIYDQAHFTSTTIYSPNPRPVELSASGSPPYTLTLFKIGDQKSVVFSQALNYKINECFALVPGLTIQEKFS